MKETLENQKFYITELELALESSKAKRLKDVIKRIHIADLALILSDYNHEKKVNFVEIIGSNFPAELFLKFNDSVCEEFVEIISPEKSASIINQLSSPEVISILDNLNEKTYTALLESLPKNFQKDLETSLNYPVDTIGRLMHNNFLSVPEHWTVKQVNNYCVKHKKLLRKNFYGVFVVDHGFKPIGLLHTKALVVNETNTTISNIMKKDFVKFNYLTDQEEVARKFKKYNITVAPVTNYNNRITGFVTVDDVVDIIDKTAEEDILHLGGINESDIYTKFSKTIRQRFPWLIINLFTAVIASMVISIFDDTIKTWVALAVLMPIIASMGGNAGIQTVTIAVRALATQELNNKNVIKVIVKETLIGFVNGIFFSIFSFIAIMIIYHNLKLAILFSLATIITLTIAGLSGSIIPIMIAKLKGDPAISSSIILTTITDVIAFLVFLGFATIFIK